MDTHTRLPSLFLSHGSPMLAVDDSPAGCFLDGLGDALPRPLAIVVASAHFMAGSATVGGAAHPATMHDFGGFPAQLYQIRYPAPGAPELADSIAQRLHAAGLAGAYDLTKASTTVSGFRCVPAGIKIPIESNISKTTFS